MMQQQQQHPKRCKAVALLALVCLGGHLLISAKIDQVQAAAGNGETTQADHFLNEYMTNLASTTLKPDQELTEQVDALAKRLDEDLNENSKLLSSLSDALNIREISNEPMTPTEVRRRKRSLADLLGDAPPPRFNPHIVHAQRRADPEKIRAQAKNDFARLSWFAQNDCLRAAEELANGTPESSLINNREGVVRRSARALTRVVVAVANYGLALFDYMYASPEFFDRIPVVGAQVRELREKGEPLYRAVEVVRHTVTYLKLMHASPPSQRRMTKANGGDDDDEASQQVVSMTEIERQKKMRELKKVISQVGIVAVKSIGRRLIEHALANARGETDRPYKETDNRVFYLLVTTVLGQK